jgi:acyl-CoA reductase-like NAD-dependent aldehyde dehydrogenase
MKMLIDSQWVNASNGATRKIFNPGSGEEVGQVPEASEADVQFAVACAQSGKDAMRRLPAYTRAQILNCAADKMDENKEELARLLASENGKPITQIRDEWNAAIRIFRGFAEESKRIFGRVLPAEAVPGQEQHLAITIRQPVGVVVAIVPFNYPVELYAHKAAAALAAGNAVIVKPPEDCPLSILKIAEILESSGLPRAAHQVITGAGESVGEALISSPGVQLITFTGSVPVGKHISMIAAQHLKKVHLELGGNDAIIVCADADLEKAADAVVLGRLARGNGQICCAVKRVFVADSVANTFNSLLVEKTNALVMGDQMNENTDVGPLITEAAAIKVEQAVNEAVRDGASVLTGGKREAAFMQPTVLINVSPSSRIFCDETFGPVAPIVTFKEISDAVRMVNDSPYGLQAAVFTQDISKAFDIAYRLQVGGVIINWSSAVRLENLPFGGIKLSGHGREGLHDTLEQMTEQKIIFIHQAISSYWQE